MRTDIVYQLTQREEEMLKYIISELPMETRLIRLGCSKATYNAYASRLRKKLNVRDLSPDLLSRVTYVVTDGRFRQYEG
jgi:FixJ family two-component response regulator